MGSEGRVMVVSRDPGTWQEFSRILAPWPLEVICCSSVREACDILTRQSTLLVFCEDSLADGGYPDLLDAAKAAKSKVRIIVMFPMGDWVDSDPYLEAMRQGAWDVLRTSFSDTDVEWIVVHAIHDDAKLLSAVDDR